MKKNYLEVTNEIRLYHPSLDFSSSLFRLIDTQRKYLSTWMPWTDKVQSESYILKVLKEDIRYNYGGQKLMTYIFVNEKIVGSVGLVKIDKEHHKAELGYWLSNDYRGRGIMTKSIKRLIRYVFKTMKINRLVLQIPSKNEASLKIPLSLHFEHEGILRQDALINGQYMDMEIYGLLKKDFIE